MKSLNEILKEREKIAKTNVYYLDSKGNIVDKEKATKCIITEYDRDGKVINEIFGNCNTKDIEKNKEREER